MTQNITQKVIGAIPASSLGGAKKAGVVLGIIGAVGVGLGFTASANPSAGWTALLTATVIVAGVAMVGPLLSAIFQMTGAKWGRAYLRLAEGSVVLMPVALLALVVLLVGGNAYLPWVHEHPHIGGKAIWLTRGIWDASVLGLLIPTYILGLVYLRNSLRRDFCVKEIREHFKGTIAKLVSGGITEGNQDKISEQCTKRLSVLAPLVAFVYGTAFTYLGFALIMALTPEWFSTLFGAWYFVGNIFFGLAILAIGSVALSKACKLDNFFTSKRRADLATLMLAFCLINVDFFWNQYLTIWYANLPEETFYLIERTADTNLPWRSLSFVSLATFFLIPFLALLLRKVKRSGTLLVVISLVSLLGIASARFIEIGPALLHIESGSGLGAIALPFAASLMTLAGLLGAGLVLIKPWITGLPIMPVGDQVFVTEFEKQESSH